jgi:hypothetical protein
MNASLARSWNLEPEILPETTAGGRLVVWIPAISALRRPSWERVGSVARSRIDDKDGIRSVAATSLPTRQRTGGFLGGLLGRIRGGSIDKALALPNGRLGQRSVPTWSSANVQEWA